MNLNEFEYFTTLIYFLHKLNLFYWHACAKECEKKLIACEFALYYNEELQRAVCDDESSNSRDN